MLDTSDNDFSLFHVNIRSHSLHHDELVSTLTSLKVGFDIIGVSETWNSFENPIETDLESPCYRFFQVQSQSQNGDVELYVKSGLTPIPKPDLCKDSTEL